MPCNGDWYKLEEKLGVGSGRGDVVTSSYPDSQTPVEKYPPGGLFCG